MAPELETSAALEHRQLLAGMGQLWALHESQLWTKMSMGKTTNAKLQIKRPMTKYKSQQWAENGPGLKTIPQRPGLGFKQYHKCQNI
jgi:hypothetical protein